MARKKATEHKYTGVLAEPIEITTMVARNPKFLDATLDERWREYSEARKAKVFPLAADLGLKLEDFDFSNSEGWASFYSTLAFCLAARHVPGFRTRKPGKWPPELVADVLVACEKRKPTRDLDVCLEAVKALWPERYARKGQGAAALKSAKTLRNLVSKLRKKWKTEHARKMAETSTQTTTLPAKTYVH